VVPGACVLLGPAIGGALLVEQPQRRVGARSSEDMCGQFEEGIHIDQINWVSHTWTSPVVWG
jgi:hypothetical protein